MKKYKKVFMMLYVMTTLLYCLPTTAFAFSESDAQAVVDSSGKEAVAGNVFVWFLCAVAFLKVSQKIDSFMSSLGINVGHTGGSMLTEALVAAKGITSTKNFGGVFAGHGARGATGNSGATGTTGTAGARGAAGMAGFAGAMSSMSGGLSGVVGRQFNNGAVRKATGQSGSGIGGKMFASSMEKGGDFANNVISSVARGSVTSTGTMTGETAAKALHSYMGYTGQTDTPSFSKVEIGGGRITGVETTVESPNGIQFGMYSTDQYMPPEGDYSTVQAVDGSQWYKQYAADTVERKPYMDADGKIAYNEKMVQKLPRMPQRKDRT